MAQPPTNSQEKVERQWTSQKVSKGHGTCNFLVHLKLGTLLGRVHFEVEQHHGLRLTLGGGFSIFLIFTPKPWGNDPIWRVYRVYFQMGWKHQLVHVTLENVLHLLWNNVSFETSLLQISGGVSLIPSHKNWDQPRYRKNILRLDKNKFAWRNPVVLLGRGKTKRMHK